MAADTGIKTNGFNKQKVQSFKKQWEKAEAEAASIIGAAMQKCKEAKDDILAAADAAGIKKSVFRKVMKRSKLINQAEEIRESIDDEDMVDQFDNVQLALGLPLFEIDQKEAKIAAAAKKPAKAMPPKFAAKGDAALQKLKDDRAGDKKPPATASTGVADLAAKSGASLSETKPH